jgi:hypothetical protein
MTRIQLSLFLPPAYGAQLDALRRVLDPVQAALIPAHVTLCREDELEGLAPEVIGERLRAAAPLTLAFGRAIAFDGHGLMLPCEHGAPAYHALRARVLEGRPVREAAPHVTLAHPRNPRAPGNDPRLAASLPVPLVVTFGDARLVRSEHGAPWQVLGTLPLGAPGTVQAS